MNYTSCRDLCKEISDQLKSGARRRLPKSRQLRPEGTHPVFKPDEPYACSHLLAMTVLQ